MPDKPAAKPPKPLTEKQRRFVEAYDGNGTAAARAAGYRGTDAVLATQAARLLRIAGVKAAIDTRRAPAAAKRINDRTARQAFWSSMMDDPAADPKDRLRASELLGRSEADFTEKVQHQGVVVINVVDPYAEPKK